MREMLGASPARAPVDVPTIIEVKNSKTVSGNRRDRASTYYLVVQGYRCWRSRVGIPHIWLDFKTIPHVLLRRTGTLPYEQGPFQFTAIVGERTGGHAS